MRSSGCSKKTRQLCPDGMSLSDQSLDDTTPGGGYMTGGSVCYVMVVYVM